MRAPRPSRLPPLIQIKDATFYRHHPSGVLRPGVAAEDDSALFPHLSFQLGSNSATQHWAALSTSSSSRTALLRVLQGQYLCRPPTARSYPYLLSPDCVRAQKDIRYRSPSHAIQYVGFDAERNGGGSSVPKGSYLSARYESRREVTDFSVLDYLQGNMELNPAEDLRETPNRALLDQIIGDLNLESLLNMPVTNLSNGQTRRARIAKALLREPELLLVDGPFMGLDPRTVESISALLYRLAEASSPRLFLSLRPQDHIPDWITHCIYTSPDNKALYQGTRKDVFRSIAEHAQNTEDSSSLVDQAVRETARLLGYSTQQPDKNPGTGAELDIWDLAQRRPSQLKTAYDPVLGLNANRRSQYVKMQLYWLNDIPSSLQSLITSVRLPLSRDGFWPYFDKLPVHGEPIVEMDGVKIQYGDQVALGGWKQDVDGETKDGLWWKVRKGQRWGVFGPNGSGKTTLISLLTSDHPQAYGVPMKLFGRSRLPQPGQPGLSLFELQANIGHASPEIHALFPKRLTVRQALESAFADTPLGKPKLTCTTDQSVDAMLSHFAPEMKPGWTPETPPESTHSSTPAPTPNPEEDDEEMLEEEPERFEEEEPMDEELVDDMCEEMDEETDEKTDDEIVGAKSRDEDEPRFQGFTFHQLHAHDITRRALARGLEYDQNFQTSEQAAWGDEVLFSDLSFSAQRLLLFLRALIRQPPLIVLDEAFSGMDGATRDKAMAFLSWGFAQHTPPVSLRSHLTHHRWRKRTMFRAYDLADEQARLREQGLFAGLTDEQALVVVSHRADEVPGCVESWLTLPEPGTGAPVRMGSLSGPIEGGRRWEWVWGLGRPGFAEREGWAAVERSEEVDVCAALMNSAKLQKLREDVARKREKMLADPLTPMARFETESKPLTMRHIRQLMESGSGTKEYQYRPRQTGSG